MRRGRPKHPDILTPREEQVLQLLREGLTNEAIATRLGISESGARYHVSEILSKLGVSSRQEAAAWQPSEPPAGRWRFGVAALLRKLPVGVAGKGVAVAIFAATAVALGLVAVGVLSMRGRGQTLPSVSTDNGSLGKVAYVQ